MSYLSVPDPTKFKALGRAWLLLAAALFVHVADEAITGFLVVYNPTVMALRERFPFLPFPVFQFEYWLGGLLLFVLLLLLLARFAYRNARWFRIPAALFAGLMLVNGLAHVAGTIAGRTVTGLEFARPMPGFWSSPFLLAASLLFLARWRRAAANPIQ